MNEEEKQQVDKEVLEIILFHLKVLGMEESKQNINLATTMFVEGVKYIKEKEEQND
jgi:competence protein ComGF